ncbi:MAG: MBOAT family protein [Marinicaulis sp.]|nr:MBOAT family protein [Marinicaulis sp.]NNL87730.1 MBOAT family protein [Marinicaulis sp.]
MVFSSYIFLLVFLPAVLLGFYALRSRGAFGASVTFLLIASFVFYAYWSVAHLVLLLGSIAGNFALGRAAATLQTKPARRTAAATAIIGNLLLIFIFKYLDFAGTNLATLTGNDWRLLNILLPLGISFFTFQQIGYIVDCYTTRKYERGPRNYALFVLFFPQLIAGPIVHHNHTRPQFAALTKSPVNLNFIAYGLMIFAMGLAKKSLIADPIARAIDPIWTSAASGEPISMAMSWIAIIGYTLQIYFDFSGYCDMAIGLGLMFGIRLPINFNSPYKSKSIIEFWRRWHITLSNFLRDYVYIRFGGNRGGQLFRLRNIFLTMLIGGVWHGAAWTFVIWGAIHAALITANHALRTFAPAFDRWNDLPSVVVKRGATLVFVMLAWVFFRADTTGTAMTIITGLFDGAQTSFSLNAEIAALMFFASGLALFAPNSLQVTGYTDRLDKPLPNLDAPSNKIMRPTPLAATATAIMLAAGVAVAWQPAVFIYFNF